METVMVVLSDERCAIMEEAMGKILGCWVQFVHLKVLHCSLITSIT